MAFSSSALNLLTAYDSSDDDSDEDVPGPKVSVKRTLASLENSGNERKKLAIEQKPRLPPPSSLLLPLKEKDEADGDSDDHNGRIRSFPHERGNWASYVYVAVDPSSPLQSFMDVVCAMCDPHLKIEKSSDLHISLTKTVVLRHHWIDPISSSVQKVAESTARFTVCFGEIQLYTNEEKTRTFIGIVVTAGGEILRKIVTKLDEVFADFKLPPFYEEASFHLSIASCIGNKSDVLTCYLPRFQTHLEMFIQSNPIQWSLNVFQVVPGIQKKLPNLIPLALRLPIDALLQKVNVLLISSVQLTSDGFSMRQSLPSVSRN